MIAKTFQGLEEVLAEELTNLGANDIEIGHRMVRFSGDKRMLYRANFCLRTAVRVLKPLLHFTANNADEVYEAVKTIPWDQYMDLKTTFAVSSVVFSNIFRHSMFVSYKVKDAIADYFREKTGERPNVRIGGADMLINIHIAEDQCTVSLDSSGESLHRRGYRTQSVEAPLNEVLAAGMILTTGWRGECDFIDPMCGSGTLPIEAALIARNVWPGVYGRHYAFEKWTDFDAELLDDIYNDDSEERTFEHHIYGYDLNMKAIAVAEMNVKAAGMTREITLKQQNFADFEQPAEKAIIVTNPPYGERIGSDDLLGMYRMMGERLKHSFVGNQAWIISYQDECFAEIGLKPTKKIPLYNGELPCQFREYEIFDGKYKSFRQEGDALNKEEQPARPVRHSFLADKPERKVEKTFEKEGTEENLYRRSHDRFMEWEERQTRIAEREAKIAEREAKRAEREAKRAEREAKRAEIEARRAKKEVRQKDKTPRYGRDGKPSSGHGSFHNDKKKDGKFADRKPHARRGKEEGEGSCKPYAPKGEGAGRKPFAGGKKASYKSRRAESYPERKKRELKEKLKKTNGVE